MIGYADEIVAALVLCLAASYAAWAFVGWRRTTQRRHQEIESLDAQGRQILTLVGQPSEGKK